MEEVDEWGGQSSGPQIRIRSNMSRIKNTASQPSLFLRFTTIGRHGARRRTIFSIIISAYPLSSKVHNDWETWGEEEEEWGEWGGQSSSGGNFFRIQFSDSNTDPDLFSLEKFHSLWE